MTTVQHLDLLADNLVPQIILKDRFLGNKVLQGCSTTLTLL